jgi:hypothetical protein
MEAGIAEREGRDLIGSIGLGEPSSSRFRGNVFHSEGQRGRGDGYCNKAGSSLGALRFYRKGSLMTHVGCPSCRLRFTATAATYLVACPECGQPPQPIAGAEGVVGFRLFIPEDVPRDLPQAVAVSIPIRGQDAGRS